MKKLSSKELEAALKGVWTIQTICEKTGVVPQTILNWVGNGMPCLHIPGHKRGALRFVDSEVKAWIRDTMPGVKLK